MKTNRQTAVVDGYNVIRRVAPWNALFHRDMAQAREALLAYCHAWKAARRHVQEVFVVFDGQTGVEGGALQSRAGVRAMFSRTGEKADDLIVYCLREAAPGALIVVSDDAEIVRAARAHRATAMTVEAFRPEPTRGTPRPVPRDAQDKAPLPEEAARDIDAMLREAYGLDD